MVFIESAVFTKPVRELLSDEAYAERQRADFGTNPQFESRPPSNPNLNQIDAMNPADRGRAPRLSPSRCLAR